MKGWKTILHTKGKQKKGGVVILTSDKADFKIKNTMRDKDGLYIMIKGTFQQEGRILMNIYAPNTGAPKYIKQLLTDIKEILTATQ